MIDEHIARLYDVEGLFLLTYEAVGKDSREKYLHSLRGTEDGIGRGL